MTRGDQRDRDRAKRQAKEAKKDTGASREGTPLSRNLDDKAALEAKLAAKKAKQAAEAAGQGPPSSDQKAVPSVVPKKKVAKKTTGLDDLLAVGLKTGKKTRK